MGRAGAGPLGEWGVEREQGTGKAGNAIVRKQLIQMASRWIRHKPDSAVSLWFRDCCPAQDGSSCRLLIALLRHATTGLFPTGAVMQQRSAALGSMEKRKGSPFRGGPTRSRREQGGVWSNFAGSAASAEPLFQIDPACLERRIHLMWN